MTINKSLIVWVCCCRCCWVLLLLLLGFVVVVVVGGFRESCINFKSKTSLQKEPIIVYPQTNGSGFNHSTNGWYEDLLTSVKRRKLKWYGYVTRSSGLAKTILQGTVQGGRRRGRRRKRWEDNIKVWTGREWNILLWKAEDREKWRKLVVKSTVVPQRSARLRDR